MDGPDRAHEQVLRAGSGDVVYDADPGRTGEHGLGDIERHTTVRPAVHTPAGDGTTIGPVAPGPRGTQSVHDQGMREGAEPADTMQAFRAAVEE